ncbi:MAG: hypothetical protein LZF86_20018 [Nitrospira sp.]|nr:MAG: hypothetical protein LZF86_20018 [Nitrospira sp.]
MGLQILLRFRQIVDLVLQLGFLHIHRLHFRPKLFYLSLKRGRPIVTTRYRHPHYRDETDKHSLTQHHHHTALLSDILARMYNTLLTT